MRPGDRFNPDRAFNCSFVTGLNADAGLLVVCNSSLYFFFQIEYYELDGKRQTQEIQQDAEQTVQFTTAIENGPKGDILTIEKKNTKEDRDKIKETKRKPSRIWSFADIRECHRRRYLLQHIAVEVFLPGDGDNFMLVFGSHEEREQFVRILSSSFTPIEFDRATQSMDTLKLIREASENAKSRLVRMKNLGRQNEEMRSITKKWQNEGLSNFNYLMFLNTWAGRTYNDITQYPVFPWVLKDYESEYLAFEDSKQWHKIFRDLTRPMGAQTEPRAAEFRQRYEDSEGTGAPIFHYGTHYSSAAVVLYFLIRLEPFTQFSLDLQGGKFDVADRLFKSIPTCFKLSSETGGMQDVKELIPEFFFLPELLQNINRFNFGKLDTEEENWVDNVGLPAWAHGNPDRFIRLHREALESTYVSENLHHWIDLIFGYKQKGAEAVKAQNVFYHLTYEGAVDLEKIEDEDEKLSIMTQITHFGQTPRQVFTRPHVKRAEVDPECSIYGEPKLLEPETVVKESFPVYCLRIPSDLRPKYVGVNSLLLPDMKTEVRWGFPEESLQILHKGRLVDTFERLHDGQITVAETNEDGTVLYTGGTDGVVKVWRVVQHQDRSRSLPDKRKRAPRSVSLNYQACLFGHSGPITCLAHSSHRVLVSGSLDKTVILWDLNSFAFSNRLVGFEHPATHLSVNPWSGDLFVGAHDSLSCWTINGLLVGVILPSRQKSPITSLSAASTHDWQSLSDACVITGHKDGEIRFWNLAIPVDEEGHARCRENTTLRCEIGPWEKFQDPSKKDEVPERTGWLKLLAKYQVHRAPVTCIATNKTTVQHCWTADETGLVLRWTVSEHQEHWIDNKDVTQCPKCNTRFTYRERRHHCRKCGGIYCEKCSKKRARLPEMGYSKRVRICDFCFEQKFRTGKEVSTPMAAHHIRSTSPVHQTKWAL